MTNTNVPETANKLNIMGALGNGAPGIDLAAEQERIKQARILEAAAATELAKNNGKSYQFPSAPNSFHFNNRKDKTIIPDGIYTTIDPQEIAELDAAVECGNIWPFSGKVFASQQIPPRPVNPNETN